MAYIPPIMFSVCSNCERARAYHNISKPTRCKCGSLKIVNMSLADARRIFFNQDKRE